MSSNFIIIQFHYVVSLFQLFIIFAKVSQNLNEKHYRIVTPVGIMIQKLRKKEINE